MPIQTVFIDEKNKLEYKRKVRDWLKSDFDRRGKPESHSWHNRRVIESAFDEFHVMVALNDRRDTVGYMIWSILTDDVQVEIDIVEVREDCRRQGIFKKMLADFLGRFSAVCVLSASVIPESREIFCAAGWQNVQDRNGYEKYIKILKSCLPSLDRLPNGRVIGICSKDDYYRVRAKPSEYESFMKYFQIDVDDQGRLRKPIVTDFGYEGYIGIYLNQELIADGKAKHLFKNPTCGSGINLLIIDRIIPRNPALFNEKGFFPRQQEEANSDEPLPKKQRIGSPTLFQSTSEHGNDDNKEEAKDTEAITHSNTLG